MTLDLTGLRQVGGTDTESAPAPASGLDFTGLKKVGSVDLSGLKAVGPARGIDRSAPPPIDNEDKSVPFGSVARGFNRLQQSGNVLLNEAGVISDESAAQAIARDEADIAKYPTSPTVKQGLKDIAGAEGWGDTVWTILKNPSTVASIVGESLPMSAAAQVAGTLGGVGGSTFGPGGTTAGLAGGTFAASFATEYSSTILDTMQAAGVDLSDPQAVGKAFADDKLMAEARVRGVKRGIPIGAFDALSFGIAGKFAKAIEGGAESISTLRRALAETAEVSAQGAAGAGGEASAQVADKGKIVSAGDVLLEAAGEIAASPVEIAIGQTRNSEQPSAQAGAGVAGGVDASTVTEGAGGPPPPSAPSRDSERLDSPRLTPADRASPLPNDLIDDGKKIFEEALGTKAIDVPTSDIATPAMRAEAERRAADIAGTGTPASQAAAPALEHTIEGTLTPAEAASAPGAAPARLLSDAEFMGGVSNPAGNAQIAQIAQIAQAATGTINPAQLRNSEPAALPPPSATEPARTISGQALLTPDEHDDYSAWWEDAKRYQKAVEMNGKIYTGGDTHADVLAAMQASGISQAAIDGADVTFGLIDTAKPFSSKAANPQAIAQANPQELRRIYAGSQPVEKIEPAAQTALKQKIKAKREAALPLDLVQFLASEGGISDHKGEVASLGMKSHFVPGVGKLMRATGMDLDRAREKAEEAGYIGKAGDYQTTTVADLLDALDRNVRGQRVYAREDAGRAENRAAEKAVKTNTEEQARQDDFDQTVKDFDLNDDETAQLQAAVERGEWASEAIADIEERRAIAFESKTRKSRTQKEPDFDAPFDAGPEESAGEGAPDASRGRQGSDTGRAEGSAPTVKQPAEAQRAGRSEEGGKGQSSLNRTASWVIRNKETGDVVMETFDRKKVDALNTDKYEAVPAGEYYGTLNKAIKDAGGVQPTPQAINAAFDKRRGPTVEPGAEGKPQTVLQGAERISEKKQAQREADKPMRPKVPQKDAGEFFDEQANSERQGEMFALRPTDDLVAAWRKHLAQLVSGAAKFADFVLLKQSPVLASVIGGKGNVRLNTLRFRKIRADHPDIPARVWAELPSLIADPRFIYSRGGDTNTVVLLSRLSDGSNIIVGIKDGEITTVTPWSNHDGDSEDRLARELAAALARPGKVYAVSREALDENLDRLTRSNPADLSTSRRDTSRQGRNAKIVTRADIVNKVEDEGRLKLSADIAQSEEQEASTLRAPVRSRLSAPLQPTDAFKAQASAIGTRLRAELDRLGLKDIGLRISEQLGLMVDGKMHAADGRYFQKLIDIALDAENPDATMQHEAIHALRDLGLFGKDEWAILERQSRKKWMAEHKIGEAYGAFPEWVQVEEGIAHAFDAWYRSGAQYDGIVIKSFRKIKAVLRAIARAFGADFRSFEDVFAKVDSGEIGRRSRSGAPATDSEMFQAAWHGTPHDFDQFSLDHMGKGEGAQAFGWGLYFAGKKGIAEYYRDKLSGGTVLSYGGQAHGPQSLADEIADQVRQKVPLSATDFVSGRETYDHYISTLRVDVHRALQQVEDDDSNSTTARAAFDEQVADRMTNYRPYDDELPSVEKMIAVIQSAMDGVTTKKQGKLFKVDLPDDHELMDWDKPLNEQPANIKDAFASLGITIPDMTAEPSDRTVRRIVKEALKQADGDPEQVALVIDNDQRLYNEASAHAKAAGIDIDADGPGDYIVGLARGYLDGLQGRSSFTGEQAYKALTDKLGLRREGADKLASEALRAAGIPGHRFLDSTSRTEGEGTYNYVIYDDTRVKVQEKFALRRAATAPGQAPAQRRTTPPVSILPNISTLASSVSTRIMNAIKGGPSKNDGESIGDYSMRKIVDYLHPLREMIDSVGPVADRVNAYLEARLALDSAVASIQDIHGNFVTPAVEALTRAGASLDELHQYLYALHAEERNRVVGLRNEPGSDFFKAVTDLNTVGASGWSTNHARQVLRQLRVDPQKFAGIQQAGRLVRQMLDENLLAQKNAGLISDASYNSLSQQWQNYVPLQAEDGIDENGDFQMPGRGRGFDVRGKEFKGATGRFTEAENIPAWAISATERSKLRQAKNRVGKSILRFINQYDPMGTNLAEVYWSDTPAGGFGNIQKAPPVYKRELDASGKVVNKAVPYSTIAPDMYATKVAGKTFYIKFADEKVGQALKNMNAVQMNFLFRLSRKITNFQSLVNTRINPAFTPTNFFRDVTTGAIHLLDEGFSGRETAKILGNIPTAWGALWRSAKGRPGTGPMDTALAELTKAGGRLIFEQQKTVEESIKSLHSQMKAAASGKGSPRALWEGLVKLVGDINDTVEMGIRLSSYVAARGKGKTVKQAAFMIRDLTVDFRKHGEIGPTGNALFTFFNASVQGNFNVASRLLGSRKVQAAAATIALSGFMMDMLNRSLSGDDDDGENLYEKMLRNEPWKFERQMVIFYGPGKGSYFTIPLPYGYNAIYHMGVQTSAAANGDVTPFEAMSNTMRVMVDAFNPMGGGGGWVNMFAPTVLDPFIEIDRNKNFADIPIYPTTYPGDTTPDSQQSFGNTADVWKWAAEQVNAATGGNKIEPGAVDIHPDTIEHMWDFVSGGLGRFFGQVADPLVKAGTGRSDEIAVEKLPFVRSFYGEQGDDNKRSEYYNKREAVQTAKSRLHDYRDAGDPAETQDFIERNKVDVESIPAFDAAEKRLRKIRKQRRRIEAEGGDTSALDEAERKTMAAARLAYSRNAAKAR